MFAYALVLSALPVQAPDRALDPVPIERVTLKDKLFQPRIEANAKTALPACFDLLASSGRAQNFAIAAKKAEGEHKGPIDADADVYRTLEGLGWTSVWKRDPSLETRADALIEDIAAAQAADGYLNTRVQIRAPDARWKDLATSRELHCGGLLIEAGVAYARGTGKTKLLDVARKFADLVDAEFGPGKKAEVDGAPGIELALVELSEHTGDARYAKLAKHLVDLRGAKGRASLGAIALDQAPIREHKEIAGNALFAMNLYEGAAGVAIATGDRTLLAPLESVWNDLVVSKLYATGGIGSSAQDGSIVKAFELSNEAALCDPSASAAMVHWAQRMFVWTGEAKYGEIAERALFNILPATASMKGDAFFVTLPLASDGSHRRAAGEATLRTQTELARFWPQVGGLIYATRGNSLYVNQHISSHTEVELAGVKVRFQYESELPNSGRMAAKVFADQPATFQMKLRRPEWCESAPVKHDLKEAEHVLDYKESRGGWEPFERNYENQDGFFIHFLAPVRRAYADARIAADQNRVSLMRGPVVYCVEGIEHGGAARSMVLDPKVELSVDLDGKVLGGQRVIRGKAAKAEKGPFGDATATPTNLVAIPYALWGNRAATDMAVWIAETLEGAGAPAAK